MLLFGAQLIFKHFTPHADFTNMKKTLIASLLLASPMLILAQHATPLYDPYMREPLPQDAPAWMQASAQDPAGVRYATMDSLFADWLAKDVDARVKTIDKKPAVNFYRRWMKAYRSFVGADGYIHLPTYQAYVDSLELQNKRRASAPMTRTIGDKRWRNIGPNTTMSTASGAAKLKDSQACVFRLDVARSNPNVVYAGTETGVVFKTTDKGETWQPCAPLHNFGGSIYAIHVSPDDENVVYVGGGLSLWKTTDGGDTWTRLEGITTRVNSIRQSPTNRQRITVSTGIDRGDGRGGFYTSTDGGQHFTQTFSGACHDHELQPGNDQCIYLLAKASGKAKFSFYVSEDGGASFVESALPVANVTAGRLAVSRASGGEQYVYALINARAGSLDEGPAGGLGLPHILKSTDAGRTWTDNTTRSGRGQTFSGFVDNVYGGQGYFDMAIGASENNPEHVIFGLCSAYRSEEGGKGDHNRTAIGGYHKLSAMHPDIQDIVICGNDTWITTDGGIKYSADFFKTDGIDRNTGIYASDYHGFGQGWNEDIMAGGRWHNGDAVHHQAYGEGTTIHVGGVEQATGYVMLSEPRKVYFSDAGMSIVPATLNGTVQTTYDQFGSKKPIESLQSSKELCFDPRYAKRVLMASREDDDMGKIFLSEDEGRSFTQLYDLDGEDVLSYEFARSNPDYIYVAGKYDVFYTTDGGSTWDFMETRAFPRIENQMTTGITIAVDPKQEQTLWWANANYAGAVAYTTDLGKTWHYPLTPALKDKRFNWIILTGNEHNGVYIGTASGEANVYYKDDTMSEWVDYSAGLPAGLRITRLTPFYKEGKLRAATNQGIWEIPLYAEHFSPIAQPMALNIGHGDLTNTPNQEVIFDSYSIVNQNDAQWEWSFSPQPKQVIGANERSPRVVFGKSGKYDVTLKVTTPQGTHSRTMREMITIGGTVGIEQVTAKPTATVEWQADALQVTTSGLHSAATLTLHDVKGRLLHTYTLPATDAQLTMPLPSLQAGVYLYELRSKTHKFFGKFIKQ